MDRRGLKPGDAVIYRGKERDYEAYVEEFERHGQKGTVCIHMNWDGDGVYIDVKPDQLRNIKIQDLSPVMLKDAQSLRRKRRKP